MNPVEIHSGDSPVVLGLPHTGTFVPDEVLQQLNQRGRGLDDTDWHIHTLYDGLLPGATTVRATFHRYVVDANRDPGGTSLYPGQNTTGLVPLTDFDGNDIWNRLPDADEIDARRQAFHEPYHAALQAELERVRDLHGVAILYDCHSIRSHIPFLFDDQLPDLNIGTNGGATCASEIESRTVEICSKATAYSSILNGRFKGGWSTRHYGRPEIGFHAIQMELAQSIYLENESAPWNYDQTRAAKLRPHLAELLQTLADIALTLGTEK
ncbi:MAG: N-formylglutamate deformylase [Rhizobiaceae bacterium]